MLPVRHALLIVAGHHGVPRARETHLPCVVLLLLAVEDSDPSYAPRVA